MHRFCIMQLWRYIGWYWQEGRWINSFAPCICLYSILTCQCQEHTVCKASPTYFGYKTISKSYQLGSKIYLVALSSSSQFHKFLHSSFEVLKAKYYVLFLSCFKAFVSIMPYNFICLFNPVPVCQKSHITISQRNKHPIVGPISLNVQW